MAVLNDAEEELSKRCCEVRPSEYRTGLERVCKGLKGVVLM